MRRCPCEPRAPGRGEPEILPCAMASACEGTPFSMFAASICGRGSRGLEPPCVAPEGQQSGPVWAMALRNVGTWRHLLGGKSAVLVVDPRRRREGGCSDTVNAPWRHRPVSSVVGANAEGTAQQLITANQVPHTNITCLVIGFTKRGLRANLYLVFYISRCYASDHCPVQGFLSRQLLLREPCSNCCVRPD